MLYYIFAPTAMLALYFVVTFVYRWLLHYEMSKYRKYGWATFNTFICLLGKVKHGTVCGTSRYITYEYDHHYLYIDREQITYNNTRMLLYPWSFAAYLVWFRTNPEMRDTIKRIKASDRDDKHCKRANKRNARIEKIRMRRSKYIDWKAIVEEGKHDLDH